VAAMQPGVDYRLSFKIRASSRRTLSIFVRDNSSPWTTRKSWTGVVAQPAQSPYVMDFRIAGASASPRISFDMGADSAEICLDDISLRAIPATLVAPPESKEEGVLLASVRDRLVVEARAGSAWELRSIDGRRLLGGEFSQGGRQILPDIPRATSFLVLRDPEGPVRSFRVVRF